MNPYSLGPTPGLVLMRVSLNVPHGAYVALLVVRQYPLGTGLAPSNGHATGTALARKI